MEPELSIDEQVERSDASEATAVPIAGFARAIRAHRGLFIAIVAAALFGSAVWLAVRSPVYEATAELLVTPVPDTDQSLVTLPLIRTAGADPARAVNTAAALVTSQDVVRRASERLDGELSPRAVDAATEIVPSETENLVAVEAHAADPDQAARIANAYGDAVIEVRRESLKPLVAAAIDRATSELDRLSDPASLRAQQLQARIADLNTIRNGADPTISISTEASPPPSPSGAEARLVLLLALVAGVAIAATTVVVIELLVPGPIEDEEQLRVIYPLPVLARVPRLASNAPWSRQSPPPPGYREAFRTLRGQLELRTRGSRTRRPERPGAVGIVSATTGDGKTTVAIGLGDALAAAESTALIVEMDVRAPELATRLGIEPSHDLSTVLGHGSDLSAAVTAVPDEPGLTAVVAPAIDNARVIERISSGGPGVVAAARRYADCAIVDTAALGEVSDSLSLLDEVDEFVIVVRFGHTSRAALAGLRSTLTRAGLTPAGFVLIGAERVAPANWRHVARSRRRARGPRQATRRP